MIREMAVPAFIKHMIAEKIDGKCINLIKYDGCQNRNLLGVPNLV